MKLSEHKISKVLKEQDTKKSSVAVGVTSGYMKLCCYALKKLTENNIICTFENICAALWVMFPKVDKMHLFGFDDIPDTDLMMKAIKMRSWHDYKVFGGGNSKDKKSQEPWYLTEKGALWAKEVEGILSGKISSVAKEKIRTEGSSEYHNELLEEIVESELYKIFKENPEIETIRRSMIATNLGIYFIDMTFKKDYTDKKKEIENILKQRKTDKKSSEIDSKVKEFLDWTFRYASRG